MVEEGRWVEKSTKKGRSGEIRTHGEVAWATWLRINTVYDTKRREREEFVLGGLGYFVYTVRSFSRSEGV